LEALKTLASQVGESTRTEVDGLIDGSPDGLELDVWDAVRRRLQARRPSGRARTRRPAVAVEEAG
jgi:chorismate synthase